jgi:indolepyruvate ferredoxin oxidoreductase alpha subunit
MKKLLSGNEAIALGAYHAGVEVAASYPGTPSSEIMEALAQHDDIYAEWSTNEKVAMELGLGASYSGARTIVTMKQVGLNVAADPFMSAAITGVNGGLVVVSAGDPGMHSSQNEQDNRHYARLAKVPLLEPGDSQEAYDFARLAFSISEQFDTPVMLIPTTRVSHSKSLVEVSHTRNVSPHQPFFQHDVQKYVMLPVFARIRRPIIEDRLVQLADYAETFEYNKIQWGERNLGVIASGISYNYAREIFPKASFLKLGMSYPLPEALLREFAKGVDKIIVVEELDPVLEKDINALGIEVTGKKYIPRYGELNSQLVEDAARNAGLIKVTEANRPVVTDFELPGRPPLLCPGCPHAGLFFTLSTVGKRAKLLDGSGKSKQKSDLVITGDIGCYTLGAYPPYQAIDTTECMGASIGEAMGMEKAGIEGNVVAVIGDSTFLHSGITGLVDAVYNLSSITVIILDNLTTGMTGHQNHPGTGVSAQGKVTKKVVIEDLVKGMGVSDVKVVDAFNLKEIRNAVKSAINSPELSVVIVRGPCSMLVKQRSHPRAVDNSICDNCDTCLLIGCAAIQKDNGKVYIDATMCMGDNCSLCEQLCPKHAIGHTETGR